MQSFRGLIVKSGRIPEWAEDPFAPKTQEEAWDKNVLLRPRRKKGQCEAGMALSDFVLRNFFPWVYYLD